MNIVTVGAVGGGYFVSEMRFGEIFFVGVMAIGAQFGATFLEQVLVVAAVNIVAGETTVRQRLVPVFVFKIGAVMTGETYLLDRFLHQTFLVAGVRIVTRETPAVFGGLVYVGFVKAEFRRLVTLGAQFRSGLFQPQHADHAVRLVTRQALVLVKWFMFDVPRELGRFVAILTVALLGESFPLVNLPESTSSASSESICG